MSTARMRSRRPCAAPALDARPFIKSLTEQAVAPSQAGGKDFDLDMKVASVDRREQAVDRGPRPQPFARRGGDDRLSVSAAGALGREASARTRGDDGAFA